jgi:Malate/L-lactate dehydrogenases
MAENVEYIPVEMLHSFMQDVFKGLGTPANEAKISGDVLIASDLRGIPSHGVQRLKMYYDRVRNGQHLAVTILKLLRMMGQLLLWTAIMGMVMSYLIGAWSWQ